MLHDRKKKKFFIPIFLGLGRFRLFMIFSNSCRLLVKRGLNLRSSPTVDTVWPDAQRHRAQLFIGGNSDLKVWQMSNLKNQSKQTWYSLSVEKLHGAGRRVNKRCTGLSAKLYQLLFSDLFSLDIDIKSATKYNYYAYLFIILCSRLNSVCVHNNELPHEHSDMLVFS